MKNLHQKFIEEIDSYNDKRFDGLIESLSTTPSISVRANNLKDIDVPMNSRVVKWCKKGWYLSSRGAFTFDPALHQGLYYVQDASSMILSQIVSQLTVDYATPICYLDACAAPGGKTTAAIDALPNGSLVVANEYVPNRAFTLVENVIKWGYPSVVVAKGDTARYRKLVDFFDIIATDVPCSGEGMFRKDAEAVNQWTPLLVKECVSRQKEIVSNLWSALRPGGYMIYSTCTFNCHENEEMIELIINELGASSVEIKMADDWNIQAGINTPYHCYRFMPHKVDGEGLFIAVVQKNGIKETAKLGKSSKYNMKKSNVRFPNIDVVKNWILDENTEYEYSVNNDTINAFPNKWINRLSILKSNLDLIHYGINIAVIKGKDFVPTQSLAMSIIVNKGAFQQVDVDYHTAILFLRREAVILDGVSKGYVLLTYCNRPLGFVKNLGNRANNLYPQEWRILSTHIPQEKPIVLDSLYKIK